MSVSIGFNAAGFRARYAEFRNPVDYPDETLNAFFQDASAYVSNQNGGCYVGGMSLSQQTLALNLMTAHLLAISKMIAAGDTPGIVNSATIDKVTVSITPPPAKNQWQWWLSTTSYGQQLLSLLNMLSVGGFYVPGAPGARMGFRF